MNIQFCIDELKVRTPSIFNLVLGILKNSFWVLSRSLKIVFILYKEMLSHIFAGSKKNVRHEGSPNIFNHYGVWLVDLHGLIREQMGIK